MICNSILDAVGNTPIIRLNNMTGPEDAQLLVKFEGLNVGGSIKTRTAPLEVGELTNWQDVLLCSYNGDHLLLKQTPLPPY